MTYTEKELDQFLHGISLSLLSKKSAQHWRYDEETAKEIEWLEALERKVRADKADRKTEPTCDTCRHKGVEGCEQPCLGCGCCGLYEAMTENDKLKEKVVEFIKSCARCKHRPIGAMMCEESCHYEPKDEPQTIRCPKCGRTDYIRDMEKDIGIKDSHYKYKCINCNFYIKTEPTISKMEQVEDEPQTEREGE